MTFKAFALHGHRGLNTLCNPFSLFALFLSPFMSTSPYRYNHSFTPNKEKSLGDFKDGSINVKSDVSNHTQYNSPPPLPYFTRSNSSPVNNNSKVSECLDIRHINHEAIRNDMYLKSKTTK